MDFSKEGYIRIEDKFDPGRYKENEILGYAVALGELEDMSIATLAEREVDTTPRQLDYEGTVNLIEGLRKAIILDGRRGFDYGIPLKMVIDMAGRQHTEGLSNLMHQALYYHHQIALRVPQAPATYGSA